MIQEELDELARRCQQENISYRLYGTSDPFYCLRLFQLALTEKREAAWAWIIECYTSDLQSRFQKHPLNYRLQKDADDIIHLAFIRLWEQNEKTPLQVLSLGGILNYLHSCFYTAVLHYARSKEKEPPTKSVDEETNILVPDEHDPLHMLAAEEIWQGIVHCTDNKREERVMYLKLVQEYTAPEIVRQLPADNLTVGTVYQIVEKVLRRYRKRYPLSDAIGA